MLWDEPEGAAFAEIVFGTEGVLISAANRLEAYTVCFNRKGAANASEMEGFLARVSIVTAPFDEHQFLLARQAYERYRAGRKGLNFGDCFAYALAKSRNLPLLFKGDDFRLTDVEPAL